MASWGDVQTYNDMLDDLQTFCTRVQEACNVLTVAAKTCVDQMESDKASLQASRNVLVSVQKYQEALEMAISLANALTEERDDMIEYLKSLEDMDGE